MSSKIIEQVWSVKLSNAQDKLLLVALADLSNRKGSFDTSYDELAMMTSLSNENIYESLHRLYSQHQLLRTRITNNSNIVSGSLTLSTNKELTRDLQEEARLQAQKLGNNSHPSNAKLARSQRKQIAPLSISDKEKNIHIYEIYTESVPEWAEGLMHKHAVLGRQDIWESFVKDIYSTGEKNFTIGHLVKRLTQKIYDFKDLSFPKHQKLQRQEVLKQDSVSEFEEKFSNYLNKPY
ncbi:hypothetical protein [Vibrio ouci]|uniref:Helix-turn-helix domain-containing protein n=1 Tax=Vibrio ouci TaxID=2499078 RepID=A0A4Y8WHQ4_9VIBR|nr:hypothetical protein [Vibrio ouci]TFH92166.1 hypothetical protein ELS82_08345 [Vibrio ouci]